MPRTDPLPVWTGTDVYVIGGGHSLRGFDFGQLRNRNTVGCNQAFSLGGSLCKVLTFGDWAFWTSFGAELAAFDGWVATNYQVPVAPKWLKRFKHQTDGLGTGETLAWNFNTGCLALNLALTLGASRVFLLGFDMQPGLARAKHHWHDMPIEEPFPEVYGKFIGGFERLKAALPNVFPGRAVYNVSNGYSRLWTFPRVPFAGVGLVSPPKELERDAVVGE